MESCAMIPSQPLGSSQLLNSGETPKVEVTIQFLIIILLNTYTVTLFKCNYRWARYFFKETAVFLTL